MRDFYKWGLAAPFASCFDSLIQIEKIMLMSTNKVEANESRSTIDLGY